LFFTSVLCYSKHSSQKPIIFSRNKRSYDIKRYKYQDEKHPKRGSFYIDNLDRGGLQYSDSLNFGIKCPDGSFTFPNGRSEFLNDGWIWKWSKKKVDWAIENDFLEIRKSKTKNSGWGVYYRNYLNVNNKDEITERSAPKKNLITEILNADSASNIKALFGKNIFKYSKPIDLIKIVISFLDLKKNDIILDSFAGSGTTAHAVLNLNKEDGGNRKFILIEMEDYANDITSERVKRVINGYGKDKKAVEGTGGSFDFYKLGKPIFNEDQNLNEEIGEQKIREYIYYTETKQHLSRKQTKEDKYLLDSYNQTAYYFYYEKNKLTTLSLDTLNIVETKEEQYIIYADNCLIDKEYMLEKNIIFKKIPRDIKRF